MDFRIKGCNLQVSKRKSQLPLFLKSTFIEEKRMMYWEAPLHPDLTKPTLV